MTILLVLGFVALAGLFAHGAASSLADPLQSEVQIETQTQDALFECLKAACAGIVLLLAGIGVLSVF